MLKLYMYCFEGFNIIRKYVFDVQPATNKTAYCFIPKGLTYSSFYCKYGVYPPCEADLDIIPEIADKNGKYTMFSLENNDEKYMEKLREAISRTIAEAQRKLHLLELDRDGRYKIYDADVR